MDEPYYFQQMGPTFLDHHFSLGCLLAGGGGGGRLHFNINIKQNNKV